MANVVSQRLESLLAIRGARNGHDHLDLVSPLCLGLCDAGLIDHSSLVGQLPLATIAAVGLAAAEDAVATGAVHVVVGDLAGRADAERPNASIIFFASAARFGRFGSSHLDEGGRHIGGSVGLDAKGAHAARLGLGEAQRLVQVQVIVDARCVVHGLLGEKAGCEQLLVTVRVLFSYDDWIMISDGLQLGNHVPDG